MAGPKYGQVRSVWIHSLLAPSLVQTLRAFLQEPDGLGEIGSLPHMLLGQVGVWRNYCRPGCNRCQVTGGIGGNRYTCVNGQDLHPE